MQLNYSNQAAENGVYIIGSCGFDSIPADIGVLYTRDQFKGTCNSNTANSTITPLGVLCSAFLIVPNSLILLSCITALFVCVRRHSDCCRELPDRQSRI